MTLRICILEADDLHPTMQDAFIGFGKMFKQLFRTQDISVDCQVFNVVKGDYPDDSQHFDAYLVTGSKADSFGNDPWIVTLRAYLHKLFVQGDVLLGICFGHQILALVLGGDTQRSSKGWGIGVHSYDLHKPQWLGDAPKQFQLLISHRDQVVALPRKAKVLASSEFCEYAAFTIGQQVLCFQGHPEFTPEFSAALLRIRESIYCPQQYQKAYQSLKQQHDGQVVAQWMLSFIRMAQSARTAEPSIVQASEAVCSA